MNGHGPAEHTEPEEPVTYTKSILLKDDRSPSMRRTGSVDSYATSEGASLDDSPPTDDSTLPTVPENEPKMNGVHGLGISGGEKEGESVITFASSPSSEAEGDAPPAQERREGEDVSNEPSPMLAKSCAGALASRMAIAGGALAPAARNGPPSPPPLIIPGTTSLPNSPDPSQLASIQARRLTMPIGQTPANSPVSPLSGRRNMPRPNMGAMPTSSMRITPAVLMTPVVPRPLTLFPLPPVTPSAEVTEEDVEQEARRARRVVPVLMSPGAQQDPDEDAGGSSDGTSDDEGDESEGTSDEGTSTEGDARSTRSSSGGSSSIALSESPFQGDMHSRGRAESGATGSSASTARSRRRASSSNRAMPSLAAAMAPLTRPFRPSPDSDEVPGADGTPTPGPSRGPKAKERDYFSAKIISSGFTKDGSPVQTPKPKTPGRPRGATDADERPRPGLYHQKSQSLVDLGADIRKMLPAAVPNPEPIPEDDVLSPKPAVALKRRTSLPAVNPPPYFPPHPHAELLRTSGREEEGKEKLPAYSCGVHIEGTLQRKMEFSAPGVQARDRSWKKYWFELHGSSLKVFRHDLRKVPVKGYAAWNGKGCAEGGKARHVHLPEGILEDKDRALRLERAKSKLEEERRALYARRASMSSTVDQRRGSTASITSRTTRAISPPSSHQSSRLNLASTASLVSSPSTMTGTSESSPPPPTPVSPERPGPSPFEKLTPPTTGVSVPALRDRETKSTPSSANASSLRHPHLPSFHHGNAMLRHYTMQGAESGLGADYKKRKNVIRVRAEGEQFLLQADTLVDVVNWIEAFQAATIIALDLDERPMPKLPTLPRRRRRRRPPQDGTTAAGASTATSSAHPISPTTASGGNANTSIPPNSAASTSRS